MDEYTPGQGYNPEDEYAPFEKPVQPAAEPEPAAPAEEPAPAQPQETPYQEAYRPPYGDPYQPVQPSYYNGYAPQPPYYQQPVQQPVQPPVQQPVYPPRQVPQGYPQPQPYYQPQQPVQPPYQPVQPQQPVNPNPYSEPQRTPQTDPNPYREPEQQSTPYHAPVQKPQTPTGTKVFIIILVALLVAMTFGFIAYVANHGNDGTSKSKTKTDPFSVEDGKDKDNSNGLEVFPDNFGGEYKEHDFEITLLPDNGETHKRSDDNKDTIGTPDEKAANIKLEKLPADKDDEKYTTQKSYDEVSPSVVTVVCYKEKITDNEKDIVSQGSGTVISSDGYIVTNAHVIGNSSAYAVNIVFKDSKSYQAKVVGYDTWTDLAVLKIDAKDLKAVSFGDSELINIGDEVIAIGSPGGVKFQNSLTKGIVSAVDRELTINKYVRYIQSDAAISPGSSGGPLCNKYGQVIGITTAKTIATNYENMSFSIPSATVETIIGDLMHYGYVKGRTRIGFTGVEIGQEEMLYYGAPAGVMVTEIDKEGSLAGTDIKENDIIVELDGETITTFQDIYDVLANHKEGDRIKIKVSRAE